VKIRRNFHYRNRLTAVKSESPQYICFFGAVFTAVFFGKEKCDRLLFLRVALFVKAFKQLRSFGFPDELFCFDRGVKWQVFQKTIA
jgi:hypothetical protein